MGDALKTDSATEIVKSCGDLVNKIRNSSTIQQKLDEAQVNAGSKPVTLVNPCKVRWASTLEMMKRLIRLKVSVL